MSFVDNMVVSFAILIILVNSVVISLTFLPKDINAEDTYDFGLNDDQKSKIVDSYSDSYIDANGILSTGSNFTASTTSKDTQDILDAILLGTGKVCDQLLFGACSLVGGLKKYLGYMFFGYWTWIDYFIAPLEGQGAVSNLFINLGLGLKAFFLVIQIVGLVRIIMPIVTGGRTT